MNDDIIGQLRRAWLDSDETLAAIGERMNGLAPQNVSQWLSGDSDLRLSSLIRLAQALGYDLVLQAANTRPLRNGGDAS